MKGTANFKQTISEYLNKRAATDPLFAPNLEKSNKNIDDCITYILNCVKKSGCSGFSDEEIYSMAVHYYDEDEIDVGKPVSCNVVVNHKVVLTEEEKAEARKKAIEKYQEEQLRKMQDTKPAKKKKSDEVQEDGNQLSLFEL